MDYNKINMIATSMIAFSTFLGVLFAMVYYLYLIIKVNFFEVIIGGIIYIDINLIFLYILKRGIENE